MSDFYWHLNKHDCDIPNVVKETQERYIVNRSAASLA